MLHSFLVGILILNKIFYAWQWMHWKAEKVITGNVCSMEWWIFILFQEKVLLKLQCEFLKNDFTQFIDQLTCILQI